MGTKAKLRRCALLGAGLALLLAGAPPAQALHEIPRDVREQLREVRRAMMKYRDVAAAEADGYVRASPCESDPKYGAMGFHYANEEHLEPPRLLRRLVYVSPAASAGVS